MFLLCKTAKANLLIKWKRYIRTWYSLLNLGIKFLRNLTLKIYLKYGTGIKTNWMKVQQVKHTMLQFDTLRTHFND